MCIDAPKASPSGRGRRAFLARRVRVAVAANPEPSPAALRPPLPEGEGLQAHCLGRALFNALLVIVFLSVPCLAQQTTPSWEIYGGYSVQRSDFRTYYKRLVQTAIAYDFRGRYLNTGGWEVSVTENMNRWFSGTFDVSGHYRTVQVSGTTAAAGSTTNQEQVHTISYGPRVSYRTHWVTPFAQLLVGAAFTSVEVNPVGPHASDVTLVASGGGGVNVNFGKFAVRPFQIEYMRHSALSTRQGGVRASAGLVFHLGKRQ